MITSQSCAHVLASAAGEPGSAAQAKAKQWRVTRQRGRPWSSPLELAIPRSRCVRLAEYTKTPGMAEESLTRVRRGTRQVAGAVAADVGELRHEQDRVLVVGRSPGSALLRRGAAPVEPSGRSVSSFASAIGLAALFFVVGTVIAFARLRTSPWYPRFNDVNSDLYVFQMIGNSWLHGSCRTATCTM